MNVINRIMSKINYDKLFSIVIALVISFLIGSAIIMMLGQSPIVAFESLFRGAFSSNFQFGITLEKFVPVLITGIAFIISARVGVFNVGVEGSMYMGAIVSAYIGYSVDFLPSVLHIGLCFLLGMLAGALWSMVPGLLKAYLGVNEVLVCILMNFIALQFASYLVSYPMSAGEGISKTPNILPTAELPKLLEPSRANIGIFIAFAILLIVILFFKHTTLGFKLDSVGSNASFADTMGYDSKKIMVKGIMISGAVAASAGVIQVLGIYGYLLDNFSSGIGFEGMLAALISSNSFLILPFISFFMAALKSGGIAMSRVTEIPSTAIDVIITIFILIATFEIKYGLSKKLKLFFSNKSNNVKEKEGVSND